ncbi:hypothetical protein [Kitasatospora aureofaciens]|uniref:hypothetical protein n=1 Tax=Kitasatospora aureofaciens TaxID=1894 RepID=UPI00131C4EC7|nr:hypothetical protein [Kitasatospora aureofaciens]HJD81462.1 hypothetical protein [Kitasatospora aureofaciens]
MLSKVIGCASGRSSPSEKGLTCTTICGRAASSSWVIHDHATGHLVKALPPRPEPLRFYSYDQAERWVSANGRTLPPPAVTR